MQFPKPSASSLSVQKLPSSQGVPAGRNASAGQKYVAPSQVSASSPVLAAGRQTVTVGSLSFLGGATPRYNLTAAAALIALIPPLILALSIQRFLVRGLTFGAVKG